MYWGWNGNDYDERPDVEAMDRIIEERMDEERERMEDMRADEIDEKLSRF